MAEIIAKPPSSIQRLIVLIDDWSERIGDAVNPILVKEARQALKSRQFVLTFSALLLVALGWTIVGSLSMMPQIYTVPSAPRMLTGYYFVLAVPMMLVVPMAAYRSLESEIDDGTLELLSISALGPWQIVLGKLASAMLQMALYFATLFPCVAYAYNLRGVDLPTIMMMLGILLVTAIMLTIASLFMAAISSSRTGRITSLFVVVATLLVTQWIVGEAMVDLIRRGNALSDGGLLFAVTATVAISICFGLLLLTATAAQLTPESENRSTRIRLAMLLIGAVTIGLQVLAIQVIPNEALLWITMSGTAIGLLWTIIGSMMVAETPIQTPRIRRELPQSFVARAMLTWLTPGPATGLVFAVANLVLLVGLTNVNHEIATRIAGFGLGRDLAPQTTVYLSYTIVFWILVHWVVALIRLKANPRAEVGLVVLIVIGSLACLVPYSIQLHLNDYRDYSYSYAQITNWVWTLRETDRGGVSLVARWAIGVVAGMAFLVCLMQAAVLTQPRRIATPERVLREKYIRTVRKAD